MKKDVGKTKTVTIDYTNGKQEIFEDVVACDKSIGSITLVFERINTTDFEGYPMVNDTHYRILYVEPMHIAFITVKENE